MTAMNAERPAARHSRLNLPLVAFLGAAAACTGAAPPPEPTTPAVQAPPPSVEGPALVVYVVVDQLATGQIERVADRLDGGLARLTGPEAWSGVAVHAHASTETCPGHATLATGASPSIHGIVGNGLRLYGKNAYCLDATPMPVESIGDTAAAAGGSVVSISIKDRGALLLAGQSPTAAVWMNRKKSLEQTGSYRESRAHQPPLVSKDTWVGWVSAPWALSDPTLADAGFFPDEQPHEDGSNIGRTFPHPPPSDRLPPAALANGLLMTPAGGDYLTAAAIAALDRYPLGQGGPPDLLTLSYSHYDGIGHQFTPASLESIDALLRLDDQLQDLMVGLDQKVGAGRWTLVLTADHGAPVGVPDYLDLSAVPAAITSALKDAGLPAPSAFVGAGLFLADDLDPEQRASSVAVARAVAMRAPGVEDLIDMANPQGPFAEHFRASAWPGRGPDLRLLLAANAVPASPDDPTGTTHGAPRPYDQNVPLLLWGVGVKAGAGATVDARQVAPTVAALLGAAAPNGAELGPVSAALK